MVGSADRAGVGSSTSLYTLLPAVSGRDLGPAANLIADKVWTHHPRQRKGGGSGRDGKWMEALWKILSMEFPS